MKHIDWRDFLKIYPIKRKAIVWLSVVSLFSTPMFSTQATHVQESLSGDQGDQSAPSENIINEISSEFGLKVVDIVDQELPRDLFPLIKEHMKQPIKNSGVLLEKLHEKGMGISTQEVQLSQLVTTKDTPEEVRRMLNDASPLATYFVGHTIVDKKSGQKVGSLASTVDGSVMPPVAFIVEHNENGVDSLYVMSSHGEERLNTYPSRTKREWTMNDTWDCLEAAVGASGLRNLMNSANHYHKERVLKKILRKAALRGAIRLLPGGLAIYGLGGGALCILVKKAGWLRRLLS